METDTCPNCENIQEELKAEIESKEKLTDEVADLNALLIDYKEVVEAIIEMANHLLKK